VAVFIEKPYVPSQNDALRRRVDIFPSVANNSDINALMSFTLNHRQEGGDFSFELENYVNSFSFEQNQIINVLTIEGRTYTGIVTNVIDSVTSAGIGLRVSGQLTSGLARSIPAISFSCSAPFVNPGSGLMPQPFAPLVDNHYRLLDLRASTVISILGQRAGINVSTALPIDYPIWGFEASDGSGYSAINNIAMAAGANAVVRFGQISEIALISHGSALESYTWSFSELDNGVEPDSERTEYTHVELSPSSEMTPWNSTYAGFPVQIGSISFQAGADSGSDSSSRGTTSSNNEFIFPETQGNSWVTMNVLDGTEFSQALYSTFGISNVWKAVRTGTQIVNYGESFYRLSSAFLGDTRAYPEIPVISYKSTDNYDVLYRWSLAVKRFESQGDIYPYLYVVPSQYASENNPNFNIDSSEVFNCRPYFGSKTPGIPAPAPPGITVPSLPGYIVPIFSNENCTGFGAASDGSFWVGIEPLPGRLGHGDLGGYQVQVSAVPEDTFTFGPDLSLVVREVPRTLPINAAESISTKPIVGVNGRLGYIKEDIVAVIANKDTFDERKAVLSNFSKKYLNEFDTFIIPPEHVGSSGKRKKMLIRAATLVDDDKAKFPDGPVLRVRVDVVPDYDYDGPVTIGKSYVTSGMGIAVEKTAPFARILNDSGLVDENVGPIAGEWSLYALPRRVYVPSIISTIGLGNATAQLFYDGARPPNMPVVKSVSSGLVTDFNTHGKFLCETLANYLGSPFLSFQASKIYLNDGIPQPGDQLSITGVPKRGTITALVTDVSITIQPGQGMTISANCGRLPTL
jgi:hypothetical protein